VGSGSSEEMTEDEACHSNTHCFEVASPKSSLWASPPLAPNGEKDSDEESPIGASSDDSAGGEQDVELLSDHFFCWQVRVFSYVSE
jgi:hypothetical protein